MNIETIRIISRRKYMHLTAKLRARKITNQDFTIISNNCWAGFIYQSYKLKYQTPTIGLYFMAEDYLLFLENLETCLNSPISFISPNESKYFSQLEGTHKFGAYPIGCMLINNQTIEIHFLHYQTQENALKKWEERKRRINMDKLIIKCSDQNGFTQEHYDRFVKLPYKNKVIFASKKYGDNCIYIERCKNKGFVLTSYEPFGNSNIFNVNEFINNIFK